MAVQSAFFNVFSPPFLRITIWILLKSWIVNHTPTDTTGCRQDGGGVVQQVALVQHQQPRKHQQRGHPIPGLCRGLRQEEW